MLGIALVISDSGKGQRLAFRYPGPKTLDEGSNVKHTHEKKTRSFERLVANRTPKKTFQKDIWRFDKEVIAKLFRPTSSQSGRMLELVIDNLRFLSYPVQVSREEHEATNSKQLSMFSLIFILDAEADKIMEYSRFSMAVPATFGTYGVTYPGSEEAIDMYRRAVIKLAAGLLNEEHRCGYMTKQIKLLLLPSSDDSRSGTTTDAEHNTEDPASDDRISVISVEKRSRHRILQHEAESLAGVLQRSELAKELERVYIGFTSIGAVDLTLNCRVKVSLTLQNPLLHPSAPWRPYHTILLSPSFSVSDIEYVAPQLAQIIQFATDNGPTKSFEDISIALNIPLQQIQRVAAHLVYWRKARVIHVITDGSIYRVSPGAPLDPITPLHFEFQRRFGKSISSPRNNDTIAAPVLSLPMILSFFSSSEGKGRYLTLSEHTSRLKTELHLDQGFIIEMVIWLLQHELLVQLHQYFYLITVPSAGLKGGPKKVRAGDARPVGSTTFDAAAAAAQAVDKAIAAEAQAAALTASQSIHSAQVTHADQSSTLNTYYVQDSEDVCAAHNTKYSRWVSQNQPTHSFLNLTKREASFLDMITADTSTYRMFRRLAPYFHGSHTATEILWREQIVYESLEKVCLTYGDFVTNYFHV